MARDPAARAPLQVHEGGGGIERGGPAEGAALRGIVTIRRPNADPLTRCKGVCKCLSLPSYLFVTNAFAERSR
jgi:hypothetical protein